MENRRYLSRYNMYVHSTTDCIDRLTRGGGGGGGGWGGGAGGTIHRLRNFYWLLPRSADSTASTNDVIL